MAETALLLMQADSSLAGLGVPGAPGLAAPGLAPAPAGAPTPFSQVLDQRMQPPPDGVNPAPDATAPALAPAATDTTAGIPPPPTGNTLPETGAEPDVLTPWLEAGLWADLPALTTPGTPASLLPDPATAAQAHASAKSQPHAAGLPAAGNLLAQLLSDAAPGAQPARVSGQASALTPAATLAPVTATAPPAATGITADEASTAAATPLLASAAGLMLSINQRLALERARDAALGTPGTAAANSDKKVSADVVALTALHLRSQWPAAPRPAVTDTPAAVASLLESTPAEAGDGSLLNEDGLYSALAGTPRAAGPLAGAAVPMMQVGTPVGQQAWAQEMAQRVTWMAQADLTEAKIQLNPRHLGPIEVRISYGPEQQLSVNFTVANPMAREALDAALPRLRDMFEQQGMNLLDANVSQESYAEQQRRRQSREAGDELGDAGDEAELKTLAADAGPSSLRRLGEGLLDAYA